MICKLLRRTAAICIMSSVATGWAQTGTTVVRVLDQTEVEEIPGIILLVNPGGSSVDNRAFITDAEGRATIPHFKCDICTITALDPTGSFFSKTTEFNGQSSSVTLILDVQPIIDRVSTPGAVLVTVAVYGPGGGILPNQRVMVRPNVMKLDANWSFQQTTESKGLISCQLAPGEYTVATIIGNIPWEGTIRITKKTVGGTLIPVHLTPASGTPQ